MAIHFHSNKEYYFQMQRQNAAEFVIPFIAEKFALTPGMRVLEIGCAEGGVLLAFVEQGMEGVGVELSDYRAKLAEQFLQGPIAEGKARIISKDIYDPAFMDAFRGQFDLIVLKDVIEHIPDQARIMAHMKTYLKPNGHIYFGFPPWQMPFGGHQQICKSRIGKMPWIHLLPRGPYKWLLEKLGESPAVVTELLECHDTGISLDRFERIVQETGYDTANRRLYFINPIYKFKFKLKPRTLWGFLRGLPWVRNFYTTCGYYLIRVKQ
jgi:SAM-dependent methyltransferase